MMLVCTWFQGSPALFVLLSLSSFSSDTTKLVYLLHNTSHPLLLFRAINLLNIGVLLSFIRLVIACICRSIDSLPTSQLLKVIGNYYSSNLRERNFCNVIETQARLYFNIRFCNSCVFIYRVGLRYCPLQCP